METTNYSQTTSIVNVPPKEEPRRAEKIVSATTRNKTTEEKKGGFSKFKGLLIDEDVKDVKSYLFVDVLIPALKKTISDIVTNGIDMLLFGKTGSRSRKTAGSTVSYNKFYRDRDDYRRDREDRRETRGNRAVLDYDDIAFQTRGDAELVLDALDDIIAEYGTANVGDVYDLAGITTDNYMVNRYGWSNLASAKVERDRDGYYYISFPKAVPLD